MPRLYPGGLLHRLPRLKQSARTRHIQHIRSYPLFAKDFRSLNRFWDHNTSCRNMNQPLSRHDRVSVAPIYQPVSASQHLTPQFFLPQAPQSRREQLLINQLGGQSQIGRGVPPPGHNIDGAPPTVSTPPPVQNMARKH